MNNEKILYYLGILENGALNYYQTVETIRIASQSIQDYIEQLEQQCKKQKEVIDKAKKLQQENEQLKELIDTILNWDIFKNECPLNFGFENNTNENKAQDVFYKDDDYCENNCNDDYTKCWLKYFKRMQELEQESDK